MNELKTYLKMEDVKVTKEAMSALEDCQDPMSIAHAAIATKDFCHEPRVLEYNDIIEELCGDMEEMYPGLVDSPLRL